ncbi:MAG: SMP-30/gluconolactonase/LRE family protein [Paracoccaceae bacterium]
MSIIYDNTVCELGEGPLWHPLRQELFWFDIEGKKLHTKAKSWDFEHYVSAAGWVDHDSLLIADAVSLFRFDIASGARTHVVDLETDNPVTRSNDGRADPWGGFWIGTMGINKEPGAGAIYRYYRGELRQLYGAITIPNAICFTPDRRFGFYTDTADPVIWRQPLDPRDGWPAGAPEVFIDFNGTGINPDGAVVDSDGYFWNAQWGAARLARYSADGVLVSEIPLPTDHITCPAFGGDSLRTLFATSATQDLPRQQADAGKTFVILGDISGQAEHRVIFSD